MVLGDLVAEKLFAGQDPVGKEVTIAGLPYRVIGVVAKQGTMFGISMDKFAIMPYHRARAALHLPDQHPGRHPDPDGEAG